MPWIKAANGNVFEVEDSDHVEKILRESPLDKSGRQVHSAWVSDPREKGAKPWELASDDADDSE